MSSPAPPAQQGAGGQAGPTVAEVADRQDKLEGKVDRILGLLEHGKDQAHTAAAEHQRAKLDAPSDVADEVRRQLEERDQAQQAAAAADQAKTTEQTWRQGVDTKLAELTEKTPEAPVRRVERLLGWR